MVEKVAQGRPPRHGRRRHRDAQDVHYVQTKTPLLTVETINDAKSRGHRVFTQDTMDSMNISNGTTALGIGVALGEIPMPTADQIAHDLSLFSARASCSSGVELDRAQIVLVGNRPGAGGRFRIGTPSCKTPSTSTASTPPFATPASTSQSAPRRGSSRPPRQRLHQVRGRPHRPPARPSPGRPRRFRRSSHPPHEGRCGRRSPPPPSGTPPSSSRSPLCTRVRRAEAPLPPSSISAEPAPPPPRAPQTPRCRPPPAALPSPSSTALPALAVCSVSPPLEPGSVSPVPALPMPVSSSRRIATRASPTR